MEERKNNAFFDTEISRIEKDKKSKTQQLSDVQLDIQQKKISFDNFKKDRENSKEALKKIESNNKWISSKKQ